jgi:hypothetical protein
MEQFKAISGQSLIDICLNTYGSLDFLTQLIQDNNIQSINDSVSSGQIFNWNITDSEKIYSIYSTNNTTFYDERFLDSIIDDSGNIVIDNSNNHII